jgi:hypothetical protein
MTEAFPSIRCRRCKEESAESCYSCRMLNRLRDMRFAPPCEYSKDSQEERSLRLPRPSFAEALNTFARGMLLWRLF